MGYLAQWFREGQLVEEDDFEDLLEAQRFVLRELRNKRISLGVTSVKVRDDRATYFQID